MYSAHIQKDVKYSKNIINEYSEKKQTKKTTETKAEKFEVSRLVEMDTGKYSTNILWISPVNKPRLVQFNPGGNRN